MRWKWSTRQACFCAFCKTPRNVYIKKRISLTNIIASLLVASVLMMAIFGGWDPRFFILFIAALAIGEVFVQLRWRISVVCKQCGFDPVLYLKDINAAVAKVQTRLQQRKNDPTMILATPLAIPKISKEKSQALITEKSNRKTISRTV